MTENPIKFGTDGWRAVIARDYTFANVRVCAQAVAEYLKGAGLDGRGLVVGYDTRFASEDFAAAVAEVVAANGIKVYLTPAATPTPVISYGTLANKAGGAVIITASHNPAAWNGFKLKTSQGAGAPEEATAELEKHVAAIYPGDDISSLPLDEALDKGLVQYLDLAPGFTKHLADDLIDFDKLRRAGLKVVIDSMYGAGSGYLRKLLEGGNNQVLEIHGERNPSFPGIRPEPIMPHLSQLAETVKQQGASVGIATDGDADRLGVVDENGRFLNTLQVFSLLCLYLLEVRGQKGSIVRTLNTSSMIDRLAEKYDVKVHLTPVGFKHIAPIMLSENVIIGGEESGGYGFSGHAPERDGVLAGLYFLDLMVSTGKTPAQLIDYLFSQVGPHYYNRVDIEFPAAERQDIIGRVSGHAPSSIDGTDVVKFDTTDGYRFVLADNAWLIVRFSGTEPLLRIYAEAASPERVDRLIEFGKNLAGV